MTSFNYWSQHPDNFGVPDLNYDYFNIHFDNGSTPGQKVEIHPLNQYLLAAITRKQIIGGNVIRSASIKKQSDIWLLHFQASENAITLSIEAQYNQSTNEMDLCLGLTFFPPEKASPDLSPPDWIEEDLIGAQFSNFAVFKTEEEGVKTPDHKVLTTQLSFISSHKNGHIIPNYMFGYISYETNDILLRWR